MAEAAYVNVDKDGVFTFHRADGTAVEVKGDKPFETDDPGEIAYLDSVSFVKRAGKPGGGKGA